MNYSKSLMNKSNYCEALKNIKLNLTSFLLIFASSADCFAQECSTLFQSPHLPNSVIFQKVNALDSKINKLKEKYPNQIQMKEGGHPNQLFLKISTHGLNTEQLEKLTLDYISAIGPDTLVFLHSPHSSHLFIQVKDKVIDFQNNFLDPLQVHEFRLPKTERVDSHIILSLDESKKLFQYLINAADNPHEVLGHFRFEGGTKTNGALTNNQCHSGHNCVSWIATAPIGSQGEPLYHLLGLPETSNSLTNPILWHQEVLASPRTSIVIYWTQKPLEQVTNNQKI